MTDFSICFSTKIVFGRDCMESFASEIGILGSKVLLVYGGGAVKRNGLLELVKAMLNNNDIPFEELSGVQPNPRVEKVREGIEICRNKNCDAVVAIGGGSVIDCSKAIATGFCYSGDVWDLVSGKQIVKKAIPVAVVLTMAGTGSEMSDVAVISDMSKNRKLAFCSSFLRPAVAFMNPELTFTLNTNQTFAGIADAFSHAMESYFTNEKSVLLQPRLGEAVMNTLVISAGTLAANPHDYDARANVMWASSWAMNGIIGAGNPVQWTMHAMEHELSAYYDITHGLGLGILIRAWIKWAKRPENFWRYREYLRGVFEIDCQSLTDEQAAELAVEKTNQFMDSLEMPKHLREVGISDKNLLGIMASNIADKPFAFIPMTHEKYLEIFELAW